MIMAHSDDEGLVIPPNVAPIADRHRPDLPQPRRAAKSRRVHRQNSHPARRRTGSRRRQSPSRRPHARRATSSTKSPTKPSSSTGATIAPAINNTTGNSAASPSASKSARATWTQAPSSSKTASTAPKKPCNFRHRQCRLAAHPARRRAEAPCSKKPAPTATRNIRTAATYDEMKKLVTETGGFVRCHFTPNREIEAKIKEETKATVRCIPFDYNGPKQPPAKTSTPARKPRRRCFSRRRIERFGWRAKESVLPDRA